MVKDRARERKVGGRGGQINQIMCGRKERRERGKEKRGRLCWR